MNLSTYLQMPPAPPAAQGTSTQAAQGVATVAGQAAGVSLGFDFAQVMAKQMVRFTPQQRQEFAASSVASPTNDARLNEREPVDAHSEYSDSQTDTQTVTPSNDARNEDTPSSTDRAQPARRSAQRAQSDTSASTPDPLAAVMTQLATVVTPVNKTPATPKTSVDGTLAVDKSSPAITSPQMVAETTGTTSQEPLSQMASQLQTIELNPRVRIITDPKQAPNPESLTAFAKSMGLDDNAIQSLMGQAPPSGTTPAGMTAATGSSNPANLLTQANAAPNAPSNASPDSLQTLTSTTLQNAQISVTPATTTPVAVAAATAAHTPATTEFTSGSLLPAMSQADMASIQQLQVTVLPASTALPMAAHAVGTAATGADVTAESFSLLGGHLTEQDIADLASGFGGNGTDMGSESQSGETGNSGFGFGQAMSSATPADKTGLNKTNNAQASQSMSEVYDQLSDKLSTEMAARIHKQLSDGQWKMKFGLRPENLGGVEIQLEMKNGKLDAVFRADSPLTRDLLQNSSQRLRDALENFGIQPGLVQIGQDGSGAQHRQSGNSTHQTQVSHNSGSQVSDDSDVASTTDNVRNKADASLLDLYA